jgi:hypothetical protein
MGRLGHWRRRSKREDKGFVCWLLVGSLSAGTPRWASGHLEALAVLSCLRALSTVCEQAPCLPCFLRCSQQTRRCVTQWFHVTSIEWVCVLKGTLSKTGAQEPFLLFLLLLVGAVLPGSYLWTFPCSSLVTCPCPGPITGQNTQLLCVLDP